MGSQTIIYHEENGHEISVSAGGGISYIYPPSRPTAFRIKRAGSVLYIYYLIGSSWTLATWNDFGGSTSEIGDYLWLNVGSAGNVGGYATFDNLMKCTSGSPLPSFTSTTTATTTTMSYTSTTTTASSVSTTTTLPPPQDEVFSTDLSGWTIYKQDGTETALVTGGQLKLAIENTKDSLVELYHQMSLPDTNYDYTIDILSYTAADTTNGGIIALSAVSNDMDYQVAVEIRQDSDYVNQWRGTTKFKFAGVWIPTGITFATSIQPTKLKVERAGQYIKLYIYIGVWVLVDTLHLGIHISDLLKAGLYLEDVGTKATTVFLDNLDYTV